jgi:KDO2-lipid IV(A) lauroyltransferase
MYYVLSISGFICGAIGEKGQEALAKAITWLLFDVTRVRRELMISNLEIAFPAMADDERVRVARTSLYHLCLTMIEFLASEHRDISAQVTVKNPEYAKEVLARGQGMYAIVTHLGNWEAFGSALTRQVAPTHVIVKKVGGPSMNRRVEDLRAHNDFLTIKRQKKGDAYAAIREALGANRIIGFVMDQSRPGEPKLPFFGRPAKTNTSLAAIWRKCPAPLVPALLYRIPGSRRMEMEFLPEIKIETTADEAGDILRHSTAFNEAVETIIRRHPDQYFWMHARWK